MHSVYGRTILHHWQHGPDILQCCSGVRTTVRLSCGLLRLCWRPRTGPDDESNAAPVATVAASARRASFAAMPRRLPAGVDRSRQQLSCPSMERSLLHTW